MLQLSICNDNQSYSNLNKVLYNEVSLFLVTKMTTQNMNFFEMTLCLRAPR